MGAKKLDLGWRVLSKYQNFVYRILKYKCIDKKKNQLNKDSNKYVINQMF